MNYDKIISNYFVHSDTKRISAKLYNLFNGVKKYSKYTNIRDYILNRYSDLTCVNETIWRMYFGIEIRPVCSHCGKPVKFYGKPFSTLGLYSQYCSHKCCGIHTIPKNEQTNLERHGDKYYRNREKAYITNILHGGCICSLHSEAAELKSKETMLEKTGYEYWFQTDEGKEYLRKKSSSKDTIRKREITTYINHGDTCFTRTEEYKTKVIPKISATHKQRETQIKRRKTQRERGTINSSSEELNIYNKLVKIYGVENIINNDFIINEDNICRYPYAIDFYIKPLDLYIEYQGFWKHGKHPFTNSDEDNKIINKWKLKAEENKLKTGEDSDYLTAIDIWSKTDPEKRKVARLNDLNYLEIWRTDDIDSIINDLEKYCEHKPEHTCLNRIYNYSSHKRIHTKEQLDIVTKAKI